MRESVMWSMYADNHQGICLGFDVPDDAPIYQVQYVSERVRVDELNQETMRTAITFKFDDWRYERDWRLFIVLPAVTDGGHYFADYADNIALKQVIGDRPASSSNGCNPSTLASIPTGNCGRSGGE